MKRMLGIILMLIVLAAFTPLCCFAAEVVECDPNQPLPIGNGSDNYTTYTLGNSCDNTTVSHISISGKVSLDLNGYQLNSQGDITCLSGSCSLTITDNSNGETGALNAGTINIDGSFEVSGGTVNASGEYYGIRARDDIKISGGTVNATGGDLDGIFANGDISIESGGTVTKASGGKNGIYAGIGSITITNGGTVTKASGTNGSGISGRNITIDSSTVKEASGGQNGINANGYITITNGGTVTKASGTNGSGIYAASDITIESGGTVTEASGGTSGIYAERNITIESGGTVTAAGGNRAIDGTVKNKVPGIGWTNKDGTQGDTGIPVSESGQSLSSYKKVLFPAETGDVTFEVKNGAWNDGSTGVKTGIVYSTDGTTWTLPEDQIPAVDTNLKGSWDPDPSTATPITPGTTYTYTYKDKAAVTTAPAARDLTYSSGKAQALVTAGTAEGGTMQYALGEESSAPENGWSSSIPTGTGAGTYFVWYKVVGDQSHSDSDPQCVQVRIKEADDLKSDVIQNRLTSVPAELAEIYSDFSELQNALMAELRVNGEPAQIEQTAFYDVELVISTDGIEWVKAKEENFPKDGLWVLLKYPEGTGKDTHDFRISHMFTVTSPRLETKAGDVEYPVFEKTDEGLRVKLKGLSPVAIAWRETEAMELPAEISVVQGNGEKGVPEDVKARTIRLTIRLKQNGEVKLSSAPIELAVTPGGNTKPAEISGVVFTPNVPDFKKTCGNYEYEVAVTPDEVKADIAGAGDDGPAYLLKAAAGSPDCEKFVVTLYWNSKAAAPEPEVIRVVALPEDEIGAYQLRADGTKEYLLFQTYDICMTYLGRDELCRGPERCYHK